MFEIGRRGDHGVEGADLDKRLFRGQGRVGRKKDVDEGAGVASGESFRHGLASPLIFKIGNEGLHKFRTLLLAQAGFRNIDGLSGCEAAQLCLCDLGRI